MGDSRTVAIGGETLTFAEVDIAAPWIVHQTVKVQRAAVDYNKSVEQITFVAGQAKEAGFTHYNLHLGLWAVFPPEGADENAPPCVLSDVTYLTMAYPKVALSA